MTEDPNSAPALEKSLQESLAQVNQEISRLTTYLNAILKNIGDAILFVDLEGTISILNLAAQKLLGFDPTVALQRKFWQLFPDDYFGFSMREALRYGFSHKLLYRNELEITTSFIFEGPKKFHGMLLIFRDTKEKQKLQIAARRNERMQELGTMAATVAHEIRNPLGGIRGFATLLHRDLEHNQNLAEMASQIIDGTKALEKVVSAILHFSKPVDLEIQTLDMNAYLKQLAKFIKADPAFPSNVSLDLHIPDTSLLVPFDATLLKQALLNLLFNALQAMPKGGRLSLALLKESSFCSIAVTDTGVGMDASEEQRLFSPFFTTKKRGNGLGLVETKKIIEAHNGTIDVRSQKGMGTTFTINLPLKR